MNRCLFPGKLRKVFSWGMGFLFLLHAVTPARAGIQVASLEGLPPPGVMVSVGEVYNPAIIRGLKVFPDDPFRFQFVIDRGNDAREAGHLKVESKRLIKYFLTSLTIPEEQMWVNLSPYENDRIIPHEFGQTGMGREFLAQDYLLKQIAASVLYPEGEAGKKFWAEVYSRAQAEFGTTHIPFDTFNKVWIMPDKAVIFEDGDKAVVTESRLKVMLDSDYTAMSSANGSGIPPVLTQAQVLGRDVLRSIVIPILERDVNEGRNFAPLRQVYNALILASWFKQRIKSGVLAQDYVNQKRISGLRLQDTEIAQKVYKQYLEAFKTGVYNYVKEEPDSATGDIVPRKYFSGGVVMSGLDQAMRFDGKDDSLPALSGAVVVDTTFLSWPEVSKVFGEGFYPKEIKPGDVLEADDVMMKVLALDEGKNQATIYIKGASLVHRAETMRLDVLLAAIGEGSYKVVPYHSESSTQSQALFLLHGLESLKRKDVSLYDKVLKLLGNGLGLSPAIFNQANPRPSLENFLQIKEPLTTSDEHIILQMMAWVFPSINISKDNIMMYINIFDKEGAYFRAAIVLLQLINDSVATVKEEFSDAGPSDFFYISRNAVYLSAELKAGSVIKLLIADQEISFANVVGVIRMQRKGRRAHYGKSNNDPVYYSIDGLSVHFTAHIENGSRLIIRNLSATPLKIQYLDQIAGDLSADIFEAGFDVPPAMLRKISNQEEELGMHRVHQAPQFTDLYDEPIVLREKEFLRRLFVNLERVSTRSRQVLASALYSNDINIENSRIMVSRVFAGLLASAGEFNVQQRKVIFEALFVKAPIWGEGRHKMSFVDWLFGPQGFLPQYFGLFEGADIDVMFARDEVEYKAILQVEGASGSVIDAGRADEGGTTAYGTVIAHKTNKEGALRMKVLVRTDNSFQNVLADLVETVTRAFIVQRRRGPLPQQAARIIISGVIRDVAAYVIGEIDRVYQLKLAGVSLGNVYETGLLTHLQHRDIQAFLFARDMRDSAAYLFAGSRQPRRDQIKVEPFFYLRRLALSPNFERNGVWKYAFSEPPSESPLIRNVLMLKDVFSGKPADGASDNDPDWAMKAAPAGGIDFRPETLPISIKKTGKVSPHIINPDKGQSLSGPVSGYIPVNIRISPLKSLVEFLN